MTPHEPLAEPSVPDGERPHDTASDPAGGGFEAAWPAADRVPGWLTRAQGECLHTHALAVPQGGTVLEIGSHQGRSTAVLGHAAAQRDARVIAVDPFVDGRLFGGASTRQRFEETVRRCDLERVVELVPEYSTRLRPGWTRPLDLVYVDGKHDYWTVRDDLRWSEHLAPGGRLLLHDCFSSIGVTLGVLAHVLPSRSLRYVGRVGSLAVLERVRPSRADRLAILRELPWWLRNVGIKVLLRLRLRRVAAWCGHDSPYDPY